MIAGQAQDLNYETESVPFGIDDAAPRQVVVEIGAMWQFDRFRNLDLHPGPDQFLSSRNRVDTAEFEDRTAFVLPGSLEGVKRPGLVGETPATRHPDG